MWLTFLTSLAGLGREIAKAYLSRPNNTAIAAVRNLGSKERDTLRRLPSAEGSRFIVVKIDSPNETDASTAMSELRSVHKIESLNVVVANAGISQAWPTVHEAKLEDVRAHFEINVLGIITLFQAVRPLLLVSSRNARPSKFIAMGSTAGWLKNLEQIPFPNAAYGPSKAALHWISKKIHQENLSIAAFPVHPGWGQTELSDAGARANGFEKATITIEESIVGLISVVC
jgi:norsolorinic acid ketoreductase